MGLFQSRGEKGDTAEERVREATKPNALHVQQFMPDAIETFRRLFLTEHEDLPDDEPLSNSMKITRETLVRFMTPHPKSEMRVPDVWNSLVVPALFDRFSPLTAPSEDESVWCSTNPETEPSNILVMDVVGFCRMFVALCGDKVPDRCGFYFDLFIHDKDSQEMTTSEFFDLLKCSAWFAQFVGADQTTPWHVESMLQGLSTIRRSSVDSPIRRTQFINHVTKSCHRLLAPIEFWLLSRIVGSRASPPTLLTMQHNFVPNLDSESDCGLTSQICWALSLHMPAPLAMHHRNLEKKDFSSHILDVAEHSRIEHVGWSKLFSSETFSRSLQALVFAVEGYAGPTLVLIKAKPNQNNTTTQQTDNNNNTSNTHILAVYVSEPWKSSHYFGQQDCFLATVEPNFLIIPSTGSGMNYACVLHKQTQRTEVNKNDKGLYFGGQLKSPRLFLAEDLSHGTCRNYCETFRQGDLVESEAFDVLAVEVWGCGDRHSLPSQVSYRGNIEADQQRKRVVNRAAMFGENWQDNPDRALLGMAGINVNHSDAVEK